VALAVDRAGTAYAALSVGDDAVIGKLAADGTWDFRVTLGPATPAALVWDAGALYVTGATASPDFPTHRAGQAWLNGRSDAFATRIEATDGQVLWSTYLGGAGADAGTSVAIAESTIAAIGGYTSSKDFPRARADLPGWQGGEDGFVAYLHVAQATVLESSYIGTALDDRVLALAVVGNRLEVGGSTGATTVVVPSQGDQPVSTGAIGLMTSESAAMARSTCVSNVTVTDFTDLATSPATGSLRWAVAQACDGATIAFSPARPFETICLADRILLNKSLTISEPGQGTLAIDGGESVRVFFVGLGATQTVNVTDLNLFNGSARGASVVGGGAAAGMGGAIFQSGGTLNVTHVTFFGNQAIGGAATPAQSTTGGGGPDLTAPTVEARAAATAVHAAETAPVTPST
jgi:hypothetical protein